MSSLPCTDASQDAAAANTATGAGWPSPKPAANDTEALQQAAHWFAVLGGEDVSAEERQHWQAWLQAAPVHQQAWSKVEAIQARFQPWATQDAYRSVASAALRERARNPARRKTMLRSLFVLCSAGLLAAVASRTPPVRRMATGWRADYHTATGEIRDLVLPDSSQVWLNTASAIRLHYTDAERRIVLLHGEIRLQTAADPQQRPLRVETRYGMLRALGTRFNVHDHESAIALAVYEGAVEVRLEVADADAQAGDDGRVAVVQAGHRMQFGQSLGVIQPLAHHDEANGWTQRKLMADDLPLGDVIATLARYRRGFLSCDPAIAGLRVAGSYPLDDTDRALRMLALVLPVDIDDRFPWRVKVVPRPRS